MKKIEVGNVLKSQGIAQKAKGNNSETMEGFAEALELLLGATSFPSKLDQEEATDQEVPLSLTPLSEIPILQNLDCINADVLNNNHLELNLVDGPGSDTVNVKQDSAQSPIIQQNGSLLSTNVEPDNNILTGTDILAQLVEVKNNQSPNLPKGTTENQLLSQQTESNDQGQTQQTTKVEFAHLVANESVLSSDVVKEKDSISRPSIVYVVDDSPEPDKVTSVTKNVENDFLNTSQKETDLTGKPPIAGEQSTSKNSETSSKNGEALNVEFFSPQKETSLNVRDEGVTHKSAPVFQTTIQQLPNKITEMVKALMVQQDPGTTTLEMKLQPEHLGEVTVKLTWSKGELSAQFVAATSLAKESLETAFPQLKQLLAQQDIRLSEAAVFMGQQNQQWDQGEQRNNNNWQYKTSSKIKSGYTLGLQPVDLSNVETDKNVIDRVDIVV